MAIIDFGKPASQGETISEKVWQLDDFQKFHDLKKNIKDNDTR